MRGNLLQDFSGCWYFVPLGLSRKFRKMVEDLSTNWRWSKGLESDFTSEFSDYKVIDMYSIEWTRNEGVHFYCPKCGYSKDVESLPIETIYPTYEKQIDCPNCKTTWVVTLHYKEIK